MKSSIKWIAIAGIAAALSMTAVTIHNLKEENERIEVLLQTSQAEVEVKQVQIESLLDEIVNHEVRIEQLTDERERIANIQSQYQAEWRRLEAELQQAQLIVYELRNSQNEDVQSWANTPVPDAALRVLSLSP